MEAVLGFIVVLLGLSHGVETYCDCRQNGAQCYGALGGTVDIKLMDSTSEIPRYHLLKNSLKILDVRKKKILSNIVEHKSNFFPSNGTFRINDLSRNVSGNYSLITFDSDGKASDERTLHLFVQAPVSSVLLVSECLSQGERRVSCSSEGGDSPQYSWTLDGRTLTDAELQSVNNENNIITLKQHVSGHLVCSVRNNVSNVSKEQKLYSCGFIFINCTSTNGTQISGWVYEANNALCIKTTTQPTQDPTMIMQTAVTEGVETHCDGRQHVAQCYGAVRGTVDIQLMNSTSKIPRYHLLKNSLKILDVRKKKILSNIIEHKSLFFPSNGTFRINDLSRTDSGNYSLITFDSDGKASDEQTLHLFVQAPVSSVLLVSECLSQGEMRVSCSSEGGDSPQYSWTLDGRTLTDAELLSGNNETNIITLKQHVSGHLVCSVRNNVTNVSKEQRISTCAPSVEYTYQDKSLLICGLRAVVVILLLIGISIYFTWKKKKLSADPQTRGDPVDSVLMIEMSSAT